MANRPPRDQGTRELLSEIGRRRERNRRLRIGAAIAVAIILLLAFVGAALAVRSQKSALVTVGSVEATVPATQVSTTAVPGAHPPTTPYHPPTTLSTTTTKPPASTTTKRTAVPSTATTGGSAAGARSVSGTVVIDPGHQGEGNSGLEQIAPWSSTRKPKVTSGTAGVVSGLTESQFNLNVAMKLKDFLEQRGVKVVMTRTRQNVDLSNIQRAKIGNAANADLVIRVHADGSDTDSSVNGIHVLYPASHPGYTDKVAGPSKRAAQLVLSALIAATGAKNRGLDERDDMTGFNWSSVPSIIPELGFMSNATEDRRLAGAEYQTTLARAMSDGAVQYLQSR
jgi:N-acetylmuramoyl-L-alanine amidase